MTTYISIKDAVKLLELMRSAKMTKRHREQSEAALADLRRALVDPEFRASLEAGDGRENADRE